jgi:hypothetical protein
VKILRIALTCLAVLAAVAAVAVLVAVAPAFQTWAAQRALSGGSGVHGTLGTVSAGFGEVDVEDLHLEAGGAVLTLPSLRAKLSVTGAVVRRQLLVSSLVAKGWTLDLTGAGPTGASPAKAAALVHAVLRGRGAPFDVALDGAELEGDVLFAPIPGGAPARVHVVVAGGGMAPGREGVFTFDLTGSIADPGLPINAVASHGRLAATMDSPRTLSRLRVDAELSDNAATAGRALAISAQAESLRGAGEETYAVDLSRDGRPVATVRARLHEAARRLDGSWTLSLLNSDLAPYLPDRPLPPGSLAGHGDFDVGTDLATLHVTGGVSSRATRLGDLAPCLGPVGPVTLDAGFDIARSGRIIRVDRLDVALAGARPVAAVRLVQPFSIDEGTGALTVADPRGDLLDATITGMPLAWLSGVTGGVAVAGGDVSGEIVLRPENGGIGLRAKVPLAATGVSVSSAGRTLGKGLDLRLSLAAEYASGGWRIQWAPLSADCAGRRVAVFTGAASRPLGRDQPVAVTMRWDADLDAIAAAHAAPALGWLAGRSASGDISASVGSSTHVDARLAVAGRDPADSLSASVGADFGPGGTVTFEAPVKVTSGKETSDLSLKGTSGSDSDGPWVDLAVTGGSVAIGHLLGLAGPLAPAGRDPRPFWGDWTGRVVVSIGRLRTRDSELVDVGGTFTLDHGSIQIEGGRGGPAGHALTGVKGSVGFDAGSRRPYSLRATADGAEADAASLFAAPRPGGEPMFEGKFSVARTFTGDGENLADLESRAQEELRLTSTAGIVRLLGADVADSLPEAPSSAVSDTLGTVGYAVGAVVGAKRNVLDSGKTTLGKTTEAVLDLTYQVSEIGYDRVSITAVRGSDGAIRLSAMEMVSPEVRLSGTGTIAGARGLSLADRPLGADLQLGAQGKTAELLSKAGLLSPRKDELGYTLLDQPLHFGGTLAHIDAGQWSDLLVKAATRKDAGGKKGG